jgi:hypothetical protein
MELTWHHSGFIRGAFMVEINGSLLHASRLPVVKAVLILRQEEPNSQLPQLPAGCLNRACFLSSVCIYS